MPSNWLGQEFAVGDIVYNGQRDGNTSIYRIGRIESFPDLKTHDTYGYATRNPEQKVRVTWIAEKGIEWLPDKTGRTAPREPWAKKSTLSLENVVKVALDTLPQVV